MEKLHKQMLKELDDIIARAPDVDVEYEYIQFCETHQGVLWEESTMIAGLLPRLLFVMELMRFQKNFISGGDVSSLLNHVLSCAKLLGKEEVVRNFSNEKRMQQMAKILERKSVDMHCEQVTRRKKSA